MSINDQNSASSMNINIGEYIKEIREEKDLSINQLALYSNVSAAHISRIERGLRAPSPDILKKISSALKVSYELLMTLAGYIEGKNINERLKENMIDVKATENSPDEANDIDNILGKRIKLLRTENGLTQEEFGKPYNLKKSTISQYESGFSKPDDELKKRIVSDFNVSLDWLMGLTDIRNPYSNNINTPSPKNLGKIISEYRQKNNLSLQDFATKADLECEYVDNLEKEKVLKSPSLGDVCKIAQSMNIPEMDLLEQIGYVKPNPKSDKLLEKCNELLEEYIKKHKNDDENKMRSKGLYTTLLIKKLFEDGLINDDGEIDDSYIELIKASLKTDSKLLNKNNK